MSHDGNYSLCEPFDIDGGELDSLEPQFIFCLGVEWKMFLEKLKATSEAFTEQVHTVNEERLIKLCGRHGREVKSCWLHEDFPEWRVLHVAGE